ncbi:TIGR03067 domain-containing protein [Novipirellula rosea]|uniref:TIGR03067 domain-containing protein n=1 Tax=Novipirellula rosea TaxID=1031540 RepID=A0ABP8M756_9BACT
MRYLLFSLLLVGFLLTSVASADDATDEAIKKERKKIEGKWQIVGLVINGNKSKDEDAAKLTVVNDAKGTWSLWSGDSKITMGTSTFDPTTKPKTIDFTPSEGDAKGNRFLGIYQLGKNARKLCFAPSGKDRPTEFSSTAENQHILVTFKRVQPE